MSDFNRVFLIGRIGNDIELKTSAKETPYLKLSIATNVHKSGGERVTYWHRVMVFGVQAQTCATYLHKGSQVLVEGSIEVRTYTNSEGRKVTNVSVLANHVRFLGGRKSVDVQPDEDESEHEAVSA